MTKRIKRKYENVVTFMSCRFGSSTVLRLHVAHAHTSRTFLLLMPN